MATAGPSSDPSTAHIGESTVVVSAGVWLDPMGAKRLRRAAFVAADAGARELVLDLSGVLTGEARVSDTLAELALGLIAFGCNTAVCTGGQDLDAILDGIPAFGELQRFTTVPAALAYLLCLPLEPAA